MPTNFNYSSSSETRANIQFLLLFRCFHSNSNKISPSFILSPGLQCTALTLPLQAKVTLFCIFIVSSTARDGAVGPPHVGGMWGGSKNYHPPPKFRPTWVFDKFPQPTLPDFCAIFVLVLVENRAFWALSNENPQTPPNPTKAHVSKTHPHIISWATWETHNPPKLSMWAHHTIPEHSYLASTDHDVANLHVYRDDCSRHGSLDQ